MILNALLCYGIAFVIPIVSFVLLFIFTKKKFKFSVPNIIIGTLSFYVLAIGTMFLTMFAFSEETVMYMLSYMPEWLYKTLAALLFFGAVCVLRYFVLNAVYFSRNNEKGGASFLLGFGMAGAVAVSLYSLYSFVYIAITASVTDFVELTKESVLVFEDSTVISVFYPFWPHIVVALMFVVYGILMLVQSEFMTQHANLPYKWSHTLIMYLLTSACETCMLSVMLLCIAQVNIIFVLVVAAVLAVFSALSVKLLYKYKEELPYHSQFN